MPQTLAARRAWRAAHRDRERERDRSWEAAHRAERRAHRNVERGSNGYRRGHFVAVDGEGFTHHRPVCSGQRDADCMCPQDYVYLAAWDGTEGTEPFALHNPDWSALSTEQVFSWLVAMKRRFQPAKFVGFGLSYDFWMMLRDFGPPDIARVGLRNHTVWSRDPTWAVEYLPKRRIRVKHGHRLRGVGWKSDEVISIDDLLTFFNVSFKSVIRDWLGDVPEVVTKGKAAREEFTIADFEDGTVQRYNREELRLTCELAKRIKQAKDDIGLAENTEMRGSGAIASALHDQHHTLDLYDVAGTVPDPEIEEFIRRSFFGGRIETLAFGSYSGPVYDYDINAAYAAAMVECLPDLRHGWWERTTDTDAPTHVAFYKVRAVFGGITDRRFFPWSLRCDDRVFRPRHGIFYVTKDEYDAMREVGHYPPEWHEVLDGWVWHPDEGADQHPFRWIAELFTLRERFKQTNPGAAKLLKVGINTLYGKIAQDVGGFRDPSTNEWQPPKFRNMVFASLITAWTRAQVFRLAMKAETAIVSFSTDGVTFTRPIDVEISDRLGGVKDTITCEHVDEHGERDCREEFHSADAAQFLMNGIYRLHLPCGHWLERSRGFAERRVDWDVINRGWHERLEHVPSVGKPRMLNPYEVLVRHNRGMSHLLGTHARFDTTAWDQRYVWRTPTLNLTLWSAGRSRWTPGGARQHDPSAELIKTWPSSGEEVGLGADTESDPRAMQSGNDEPLFSDDYEEFDFNPNEEFAPLQRPGPDVHVTRARHSVPVQQPSTEVVSRPLTHGRGAIDRT